MTISAKIVVDSISPAGIRLVTMQWRYPKFIHGEVMTHRVFSRNASSSRAIPVERLIRDVVDDPVYPQHWGRNQPGMQADEEHDAKVLLPNLAMDGLNPVILSRKSAWDYARDRALENARAFAAAGYHKQVVNRLLEPFCHINVVVTATEWSNFFALRCHPAAQPEMRLLAEQAKFAMERSEPEKLAPGAWHLPYVDDPDWARLDDGDLTNEDLIKLSVARCARVSYLTQDGRQPDVRDDLKLYDRLVGAVPLHASPAEHQATPDKLLVATAPRNDPDPRSERHWKQPHLHGNLVGWVQYRKTLPGESQ